MPYTLPQLPYAYNALEPYVDARTMEIHHTKHHQAYIDKLNTALSETALEEIPLEKLFENNCAMVPENIRTVFRNNGGGHYNHSLFWRIMAGPEQGGGGWPSGQLASDINATFGDFENFKKDFSSAALNRFGSGFAWLSIDSKGALIVHSTANQDCPLMEGFTPLLGLDVWEHAYYLHYQNRRAEYIEAFWNVVNFEEVLSNYMAKK